MRRKRFKGRTGTGGGKERRKAKQLNFSSPMYKQSIVCSHPPYVYVFRKIT